MKRNRATSFIRDPATGTYSLKSPVTDDDILAMAQQLTRRRFARGRKIESPQDARDHIIHLLAHLEHEVFWGLFLDNRHRILAQEILFRGTLDGASVHPREVVKQALQLNAAAVIFAHNHPSGVAEPSRQDISITQRLKEALGLVEVRVLDHLIVGGSEVVSLAELGHV